jgi:hypothetical protein
LPILGNVVEKQWLLLIVLDDGSVTQLGVIRIAAILAQSLPLAQQVPAAIQADLQGGQAGLLRVAQAAVFAGIP